MSQPDLRRPVWLEPLMMFAQWRREPTRKWGFTFKQRLLMRVLYQVIIPAVWLAVFTGGQLY